MASSNESNLPLTGKVFAITGGASGIGLATAKTLSRRGAAVAIADVDPEAMKTAEEHFSELHVPFTISKVDISKRLDVDSWISSTVDMFGRLDGAANVAGIIGKHHGITSVAELEDDEWDKIIAINLTGMMYCLRAELQKVVDGGSIVNVSSIHGLKGFPKHAAYDASKHGVIGLTRAAALENGAREVRVNSVAPGAIYTPLMQKNWDARGRAADAPFEDPSAFQRQGTAEETANAPSSLSDVGAVAAEPSAAVPQPAFDWISVIDEEYLSESSARGSSLANSSALDVQPDSRASDDVTVIREGITIPSTALGNLAGITPAVLQDWTTGECHLLNHFLQSVARSLVLVRDAENPFINVVIPMAFENVAVRHALVGLSACHLARTYPDFERNLLRHRSHALQCLKTELNSPTNITWSLASTLMLCLLEICAGDSRRWLLYLHGAKALLSGSKQKTLPAPLDFLVDLFDYLCTVAGITSDSTPMPFCRKLGLLKSGPSGIHPLFGIASQLYTSLAHVNQLASNQGTSSHSIQASFRKEVEAIELSLQSWSPLEAASKSPEMAEARAAAFAVQWAVVLRLREVAPLLVETEHNQTRGPVDHIISALSLIRPGSQTEAHMLFPLFMAGVFSNTKAARLTLEFRVNLMRNNIGFGSIANAHQTLDEVWRRANRGETYHWKDLMRSKIPGMILF
ncbi:short chain dehydrogenase reductase family [Seiridium cupressi]